MITLLINRASKGSSSGRNNTLDLDNSSVIILFIKNSTLTLEEVRASVS